jgi:hypothetical protein
MLTVSVVSIGSRECPHIVVVGQLGLMLVVITLGVYWNGRQMCAFPFLLTVGPFFFLGLLRFAHLVLC